MRASSSSSSSSSSTAKEIAPFLRNLRRMLDTEHASIICWTLDGVAFEIHDLAQLVVHVLPKYFKHAKYSSFQRQLNYFHFRKWTRSKTAVCTFSNPHFQRDAPDLTWHITRKKSVPATATLTAAATAATTATAARSASKSLSLGLSIVVPPHASGSSLSSLVSCDFDGLKSPTDAIAMVQQHQHPHFQPPTVSQPQAQPLPLALDLELPFALDWAAYLPHESSASSESSESSESSDAVHSAEAPPLDGASLDWIDTLYSSLDAPRVSGRGSYLDLL